MWSRERRSIYVMRNSISIFIWSNQRVSIIFSITLMNRIALILLVALLVGQSVVQASVLDIVGPLTSSAFGCLASDGY